MSSSSGDLMVTGRLYAEEEVVKCDFSWSA